MLEESWPMSKDVLDGCAAFCSRLFSSRGADRDLALGSTILTEMLRLIESARFKELCLLTGWGLPLLGLFELRAKPIIASIMLGSVASRISDSGRRACGCAPSLMVGHVGLVSRCWGLVYRSCDGAIRISLVLTACESRCLDRRK